MIDQADANAVEPAEAPEQILIDVFIGEKYSTEISWARPGRAPDRASAVTRHSYKGQIRLDQDQE